MMTMPMENNKESSSRELVQRLFDKNVELETNRRKAAQAKIPSNPNTWQQMRENYESIVLEDDTFSEEHDIEFALWQLHYRRIEDFRTLFNTALASAGSATSQYVQGPARSGPERLTKIRSQFKTFLSEATGFYHDLMLKIRFKYGLPLESFSDDTDHQILALSDGNKSSDLKKGLMSCHRCLIYLGDLARYKGLYGECDSKAQEFEAASNFYIQAFSLCPSNGNPHHQLAILAGYSNDELVSIYRYFRSLSVENPFVTARDNLIMAFEKNRQNYTQLVGDGKATKEKKLPSRMTGKGRGKGATRPYFKNIRGVSTKVKGEDKGRASNNIEPLQAFITRFIRLNGILFTRTSLETFMEVLAVVKQDFLELLPSGPDEELNFGSDATECALATVRMIAILIFTVHNVNKENENQSYADILQRSVLLQNALIGTFELLGCMVESCNKLNDPSSSFLLPGIMVFIEWLACCPDVAVVSEPEEKQMNARSFFWNGCISLLNKLLSNRPVFGIEHEEETCLFNMTKYDENETAIRLALSEDFELRGFLPLLPAHVILDFSRNMSFCGKGGKREINARVQRAVAAGKALAYTVWMGQERVYFDSKLNKFVIGSEFQISDDFLHSGLLGTKLNDPSISVSDGVQVVMKPEMNVVAEDEDEDEVILFKPSTNETHMARFLPISTSSELTLPIVKENESFSVGYDSFLYQNAVKPSDTVANVTSQTLQPFQPVMSSWPWAPNISDMANLNLMENALSLKPQMVDHFEISHPAPLSVPYPRFVSNGNNYPVQVSQAAIPSTFDSVISFGAAASGLPVKPSSTSLKQNPISRPVRRPDAPPGFCSITPKVTDESSKTTLKYENPLVSCMDDYSWLDGCPLSLSVNQTVGLGRFANAAGSAFHSVNNGNDTKGITKFPFPGKQVQNEHTKPYEQFSKGNRQQFGPPEHYQGRIDNFFV